MHMKLHCAYANEYIEEMACHPGGLCLSNWGMCDPRGTECYAGSISVMWSYRMHMVHLYAMSIILKILEKNILKFYFIFIIINMDV